MYENWPMLKKVIVITSFRWNLAKLKDAWKSHFWTYFVRYYFCSGLELCRLYSQWVDLQKCVNVQRSSSNSKFPLKLTAQIMKFSIKDFLSKWKTSFFCAVTLMKMKSGGKGILCTYFVEHYYSKVFELCKYYSKWDQL